MSKYTTEVRFICESYAGLDESEGYMSIDEILDASAPMVFDFDFPIYDEAYRLILEKRILKNFYTREISEETVGLWKLRLENKMNLIMPYYNKLYESELLEFNPLYDTDYTVDHSGEATDELEESNGNTRTFNKDTTSEEDSGNTRTLNTNVNTDSTETDTNTRTLNTTSATDYEESDDNLRTLNTNTNTDSTEIDTNTRTFNTQDAESGSNEPKNSRWDLYSDTPEGGINGITADNDSVANNTYLTNARHIIEDGTGSTTNSTLNKTGTIGDSGRKEIDGDVAETGTIKDERDIEGNTTTRETGTIGDSGSKVIEGDVKETGTISDVGNKDVTVEERGTIGDVGSRSVSNSNLNSYIDRVLGKRGSMSYSKMVMEFRETFLRIDEMIMQELEPLFFGLWY